MRGGEGWGELRGLSCNEYNCVVTWSPNKVWRSNSIFNLCLASRDLQRDVVCLSWPTAPSYMSPNAGESGVAVSQPMRTDVHRSPNKLWRSNSIFNLCLASRGLLRDVVYLDRPTAPSSESKCGGRGGVAESQPMRTDVHRSPNKLWRSNPIFNLCVASNFRACAMPEIPGGFRRVRRWGPPWWRAARRACPASSPRPPGQTPSPTVQTWAFHTFFYYFFIFML